MPHPHFHYLFLKREGITLMGKGYINFIVLCGILLLTFLSIGFASGSLDYLKAKINDPYINWVAVAIPRDQSHLAASYAQKLNKDEGLKEKYQYRRVLFHRRYPLEFWNKKNQQLDDHYGRSFELEDPLLQELFKEENYILGEKDFRDQEDLGLIVKASFLEQMGYEKDAPYLLMATYVDTTYNYKHKDIIPQEHLFPIPIRAVVKDLPGLNEFAFTHFFFRQVTIINTQNPFNRARTEGLSFYTETSDAAEQLKQALEQLKGNLQKVDPQVSTGIIEFNEADTNAPWKNGFSCEIYFPSSFLTLSQRDSLYTTIINSPVLEATSIPPLRLYTCKTAQSHTTTPYDYISIDFASLSKIREFRSEVLQKKYHLSIDMVQLEALENYHFVSRLSRIISASLILFSVLSICFFLTNVLRTHLDKIKGNIGTFKAFGLDKTSILRIYLMLILGITSLALLLSWLIAWAIGKMGLVEGLLSSVHDSLENNVTYFNLWSYPTWAAIVLILLMVCVVVWWVASSILNKTPGDLIYNR